MADGLLGRLTRNPRMKLLSLAAAVVAWVYVQGGEEQVVRLRARLVWELPAGLVPVEPPVQEVTLDVRGTRAATRRAHERDLSIALDASALDVGRHDIVVEGLPVEGLGASIAMVNVLPARIRLELDELAQRKVAVVPVQVGETAPGYAVGSIDLSPAVVTVEGPRAIVEALREVSTAPIDISGLRADEELLVPLELPRGVFRADGAEVLRANVSVAPNLEREVLAAVPVSVWGQPGWRTNTPTVAVTLEGPAAELRELQRDEVVAFVHLPEMPDSNRYVASYGPSEGTRLRILHAGNSSVTVVRVEPSSVEVVR